MDSRDRCLLRALAIGVIAALVTATAVDAKLFDFHPEWPGWDFCWWH